MVYSNILSDVHSVSLFELEDNCDTDEEDEFEVAVETETYYPEYWIQLVYTDRVLETLFELNFWGSILLQYNGSIYFGFMECNKEEILKLIKTHQMEFTYTSSFTHHEMQVVKAVGICLPVINDIIPRRFYDNCLTGPCNANIMHRVFLGMRCTNPLLIDCQDYTENVFKKNLIVICKEGDCTNRLCQYLLRYDLNPFISHKRLVKLILEHEYRFIHNPDNFASHCPVIFNGLELDKTSIYSEPEDSTLVPCDYMNRIESIISYDFLVRNKSLVHIVSDFLKTLDKKFIYKSKYIRVEGLIMDLVTEFNTDKDAFIKELALIVKILESINKTSDFRQLSAVKKSLSLELSKIHSPTRYGFGLRSVNMKSPPFKADCNGMFWLSFEGNIFVGCLPESFNRVKYVEYILDGSRHIIGFEKDMQHSIEGRLNTTSTQFEYIPGPLFSNDINLLVLYGTSFELVTCSNAFIDRDYFLNSCVVAPPHVLGSIIKLYIDNGIEFVLEDCDYKIRKPKFCTTLIKCICSSRVTGCQTIAYEYYQILNSNMIYKNFKEMARQEIEDCIVHSKGFGFESTERDYVYNFDKCSFIEYRRLPSVNIDRKKVLLSIMDKFDITFLAQQKQVVKMIEDYPFYNCFVRIGHIITSLLSLLDIQSRKPFNWDECKCIINSLLEILDLLAKNHFGCKRFNEIKDAAKILRDRGVDLKTCKLV